MTVITGNNNETYPDKTSRLLSDVLVTLATPDLDALVDLLFESSPTTVVCCCCCRPALLRSLLSLLVSRMVPVSFFSTERSFSCLISPFTCFVAAAAAGLMFRSCFTDPLS